jgi:hypothetical protein
MTMEELLIRTTTPERNFGRNKLKTATKLPYKLSNKYMFKFHIIVLI